MFSDYQPNRFGPGRSAVISWNGAVATSQPLAAQAGLQILQDGGNAIDAAVATAAMLNVVEPMSTGIGGDAFMLIYQPKDGKILGLNASGRAPYAAELAFFADQGLAHIPNCHSMYAVTVPGAVDGWATLLEKCGTMMMADVLQPAISHAENGFPVSPQISASWQAATSLLSHCPDTLQTYLIGGRAPKPGEMFKNINLARTLRLIGEGGRDAFYHGQIAEKIVKFSAENNGLFTMKDFINHTSDWVEPISVDYRGYDVCEIPPNGQGIAALMALNIASEFDISAMGHNSAEALHYLIESMKLSFSDLYEYITDPIFENVPVDSLLSTRYTKTQSNRINPNQALSSPSAGNPKVGDDTIYLSVVDKDRNVVSFINSLFHGFGSGLVAGDTGILLQNRGAGFSLDPGHANCIASHKRTMHTIIPGMIARDGVPLVTFGVMGGQMQPQGHLQLVSNLIDFNMDVQSALDAPRFRVMDDGSISLEREIPDSISNQLREKSHHIIPPNTFFGGGQAVLIHPEYNTLIAGSDPRRDGCAVGY